MIFDFSFSTKFNQLKKTYTRTLFAFILILLTPKLNAQENWITYNMKKDKSFMSVTLNIDYTYYKPNFKNLLVSGIRTDKCYKNGFPTNEGLKELYRYSDSVAQKINGITKNKLIGILTYQCYGFDVFYVKDTTGVREELERVYKSNFVGKEHYIYLQQDKKWEYYKNIYPSTLTDSFLMNQDFITQLLYEGDDLAKPRNIMHWIYFNNIRNRSKFIDKAKEFDFKIDSINYKKERYYPYELQISRIDSITPSSISNITNILIVLSNSYRAEYDGWGILEGIKED